jgi:hypothetical protein
MTRRTLEAWTAEEDERLREMVVADRSLAEIAENLGHNPERRQNAHLLPAIVAQARWLLAPRAIEMGMECHQPS